MLIYLLYSISVVLFWWAFFLSGGLLSEEALQVTLGLVYTFYSSYLIRTLVQKETRLLKFIKLCLPTAYLLAKVIVLPIFFIDWYTLLDPFIAAMLLLIIATFDKRKLPSLVGHFFVISGIILYAVWLHPTWQKASKRAALEFNPMYDFRLQKNQVSSNIPSLDTYCFLDANLDTFRLSGTGKYTLIETWNERCAPCLQAIDDLHDFYGSLKGEVNQHYVYMDMGLGKGNDPEIDFQQVFNFEKIKAKDRICLDINLQQTAQLNVLPYFLLFDKKGELVYQQRGYSSSAKEALQDSIRAAMGG